MEYRYEGNKGKTFKLIEKEFKEIKPNPAQFIYRSCEGCSLKKGRINVLGDHCSFDGVIEIKGQKCVSKG